MRPAPHRPASPLALALAGLLALTACGDPNHPPSLALVEGRTLTVGDSLVLTLTATDPDGDPLTFTVDGLPAAAQVYPRSPTEAVLYWTPAITDTDPGGRRYDVLVRADDGRGGRAETTFALGVVAAEGAPAFKLPAGLVLNLAHESDLAMLVTVKDDDSVSVALALADAPAGARLDPEGNKTAYLYWKPDAAQRLTAVHRFVLTATDDAHPPVTHVLNVVLVNPELGAGCQGTAPLVLHDPPPDAALADGPLTFDAHLSDADSLVAKALVRYSLSGPDGATQDLPLAPDPARPGVWTASLAPDALPLSGALVHYHLLVTDNDDPTGQACDRTTRFPKAGALTAAVYPPGAAPDACADDLAEPDATPAQAPTLPAGQPAARRLCGQDVDLTRITAPLGAQVLAQITRVPAHGPVRVRLLDDANQPLDEAAGDAPVLTVRGQGDGAARFVEVAGLSADARLGYTLTVAVEQGACPADAHEPNDAPAAATPLTPDPTGAVAQADLTLCPGDVDWYSLALAAGDQLTLTLAFEHASGDLDLELRAADGVTVLASGAGASSTEAVTWVAPTATTVLARVFGPLDAANGYTLVAQVTDAAAACQDDLLAPNAAANQAATLPQGLYPNLALCPGADDWFALDLNGGETLDVLVQAHDDAAFDLAAFTAPGGAPVATGQTDADGVTWLSWQAPGPGRVTYRLAGASPSGGRAYDLYQTVQDPPGPCQPDRLEPNDTPAAAADLAEGVHTWLRLCGDADDDYVRIQAPPFSTLVAMTSHEAGQGYADLLLYGPDGQLVDETLDPADGAFLETLLPQGGVYLLRVQPFQATHLPYDLGVFLD